MSVLPGLRDLRTPLAVGYLWLAVLWLAFEDALPDRNGASGILASLYRMGDLVGSAVSLAMLSFVAYIVGAILVPASGIVMRLWDELANATRAIPFVSYLLKETGRGALDLNLQSFAHDKLAELRADSRFRPANLHGYLKRRESDREEYIRQVQADLYGMDWIDPDAPPEDLTDEHLSEAEILRIVVSELRGELRSVVTKLQVLDKDQLYQSIDRSQAESEFRKGVSAPLLALIVILAVNGTAWALAGLVVPFELAAQASAKLREAEAVAYAALIHEVVPSSTITNLRSAVIAQP